MPSYQLLINGQRRTVEAAADTPLLWALRGRNLNTGGANFNEIQGVIARNAVHHSAGHSSYIELPVMP